MRSRILVVLIAVGTGGSPLLAAEKRAAPPAALTKLLACRALTVAEARLACYDAQVAAIDTAVEKKDLVVADRAQINTTRRSLFGLSLPNLAIFGGDEDPEKKGVAEIQSTITTARRGADGNWRMVIADGARWTQIDGRRVPRDPRAGMAIRIRTAAMGSFLANIDGQIAVRVKREN